MARVIDESQPKENARVGMPDGMPVDCPIGVRYSFRRN